ncbi:thump domain-containing protein [Chytriomyces sp. MP71]|nr:thump domain-containing protein [Chytriomyces sp. MP71]
MGGGGTSDIKAKKFMAKAAQSARSFTVQAGMQGVLGFCRRGKEAIAAKELVKLLDEYADALYGEKRASASDERNGRDEEEEEEDVEAAFAREVAAINTDAMALSKKGAKADKRFVWLNVGIECCLFVRSSAEVCPTQLVSTILADLDKTKLQKSRYIQRILPATETCLAFMDQIVPMAQRILPKYFSKDGMQSCKFAVVFNRRNNHDITREAVIPEIAKIVTQTVPHTVDIKEPDYTIVVEIFKGICAMSVVERFYDLKKYNLESILGIPSQESAKNTAKDAKDNSDTKGTKKGKVSNAKESHEGSKQSQEGKEGKNKRKSGQGIGGDSTATEEAANGKKRKAQE